VHTTKVRRNKLAVPKKEKNNEDEEAFVHDIGDLIDDGDDGKAIGGNTNTPPNPNPFEEPNDQGDYGTTCGNKTILKKIKLGGIKYKNIVVDEKKGRYDIRFTAPHDEDVFEIELKMYGDASDTYALEFITAEVNEEPCEIIEGKVRMSLKKGEHYVVKYTTDRKSMFSSEVLMNAYR